MERETFKAWVTKYALTKGVMIVDAMSCGEISNDMITYKIDGHTNYAHGPDWYKTEKAAMLRFDELRHRKIKQFEWQIVKLGRMTYKVISE